MIGEIGGKRKVADVAFPTEFVEFIQPHAVVGIGQGAVDDLFGLCRKNQEVGSHSPGIPLVFGDFRIVDLVVETETEYVDAAVPGIFNGDFSVTVQVIVGEPVGVGVGVQHFGCLFQIGAFHGGYEGYVRRMFRSRFMQRTFQQQFGTEGTQVQFASETLAVPVAGTHIHDGRGASAVFCVESGRVDVCFQKDVGVKNGKQSDGMEGIVNGHAVQQYPVLYGRSAPDIQLSALVSGGNNARKHLQVLCQVRDAAKEGFWSQAGLNDVVNSLKFRASYGKVGNVGGLSDFGAINTYSAALYGGQSGLVYSGTGNADLQWETSKKTDVGVNFGLFGNKITGELAYYRNNIDGLIFGVPLPPSVGIPNSSNNSIMQNVGKMYNQGIEFSIGGAPIRKESFTWNTNFNLTTNKNQVLELAEGVPSIISGTNDALTITLPGYSAGMLYAIRTAGVDAATGRRIFLDNSGRKVYYQHVAGAGSPSPYQWSYEDNTQAPAITPSADAEIYKQSAPKIFGGLSNVFNYKGFELNVLLTYQLGGNMINGTQASLRDNRFWNNEAGMLRRWQTPGQQTDIPKVINGDNVSNGNTMPLDINVSSTDFLRLKSAQLSYNLPTSFISKYKLTNTRVFVSGQNLAILTNYSGVDPEVTTNANSAIAQGIDKNQSPNARTIVLGINFGF